MEDEGPHWKSAWHRLVEVGRTRMEEVVVEYPHCLVAENQKRGEKGNLQGVLEVAANNIHHLEVVVRIQSVVLVEVGKIQ